MKRRRGRGGRDRERSYSNPWREDKASFLLLLHLKTLLSHLNVTIFFLIFFIITQFMVGQVVGWWNSWWNLPSNIENPLHICLHIIFLLPTTAGYISIFNIQMMVINHIRIQLKKYYFLKIKEASSFTLFILVARGLRLYFNLSTLIYFYCSTVVFHCCKGSDQTS